MKQLTVFLVLVVAVLAARGETFDFLNLASDAQHGSSFAATGIKIIFSGNDAVVTSGGTTTRVDMNGVKYLEFSNTRLSGDAPGVKGDVNGDGVVDVTDVNCVINIILGTSSPSDYVGITDVNGDGVVDIADVNELIKIIVG